MPMEHRVDPERRVVRSRAWGLLTDEDVRAGQRRLAADPAFRPEFAQLQDMTAVTEVEVPSSLIPSLAQSAPFRQGARRAGVGASDLVFGLLRMFESHSEGRGEVQTFRDRREAVAWLGWDPEDGSADLDDR